MYLTANLICKKSFGKSRKKFNGSSINSSSNKHAINKIQNFIPNKGMLESHIQMVVSV